MNLFRRLGAGAALLALCSCVYIPQEDYEKFYREDVDRASGFDTLKMYAKDVGYDFMDIWTFNASLGKSGPVGPWSGNLGFPWNTWLPVSWASSVVPMQFSVHATKYAELGFGTFSGYKAGMLGRAVGSWREQSSKSGFSVFPVMNYSIDTCRIPYCGNKWMEERYADMHGYNIEIDNNRHWADLAISWNIIGFGLEVGVSPFEALDFVTGGLSNYPNFLDYGPGDMPWDIGVDLADDDTRVSIYDDKIDRYRSNKYSAWPTIWPTTYGEHEQLEGDEWPEPYRGPETGSFGGAYGGTANR